jgi:hypothetical protein
MKDTEAILSEEWHNLASRHPETAAVLLRSRFIEDWNLLAKYLPEILQQPWMLFDNLLGKTVKKSISGGLL